MEFVTSRRSPRPHPDARAMSNRSVVVNTDDVETFERDDARETPRDPRAFGCSRLAFRNLAFSLRSSSGDGSTTRTILEPTSGTFECGEMAAIMGPSGCGKTTLLDMLSGKKTATYTGDVYLNGLPRDQLFSRVTSYVPQEDVIPAHVTVFEAVAFVQELRSESKMNQSERRAAVDDVLSLLGIAELRDELVGDARVRGISGGQKRRVTLARGLAGGSQIVFADEPTTGLSSTDAENVSRAMAIASRRMGVTFVAVIHQPRVEVVDMFDSLILLTSNPGRAIYNGKFAGAAAYFAAAGAPVPSKGNPADFFLDVITPGAKGEKSNALATWYQDVQRKEVERRVDASLAGSKRATIDVLRETAKINGLDTASIHPSPIAATFLTQLRVLLNRNLTLTKRNKAGLRLRIGVSVMQGLIVGLAFYDIGSKPPISSLSFFFMMLQMGAIANMAIMPELIQTRLILKLEQADALYSTGASIIVQSSVNNVLAILGNFVTSIIMFSFSRVSWSKFSTVYGWALLNFLTVTNYLRVIAAVAPSPSESVQAAMPGLLFFILFNNFFVSRATAPVFIKWALYISPLAWTIEQIVTGVYGSNVEVQSFYGYDASDGRTWTALCVLLAEMALFQTLEVFLLKRSTFVKR